MTKITSFTVVLILCAVGLFGQSPLVVTYNDGDIPTDMQRPRVGPLSCPGEMTLAVPDGNWITSVDLSYSMTAASGAWMSEQRSRLFSPTTGIGEAQYYSGTGAGGTMHYQQSELINKNPDILLVAKGNFWGTPDGPQEGDIVGNVDVDSWREEHFLEAELLAEDDTGKPDAAKDITDKYGTDIQLLT